VEKHYYSVPHTLLREAIWARITARTVELFHRGKRVAVHVRSSSNRKHSTVHDHMPSSHRRYADWTPERIKRQAGEIGPKTAALVEIILRERAHPEQGFRSCIGILRHAKSFGAERLEAACDRALDIGARSYSSVTSILKNNLDRRRSARATDGPAFAGSDEGGADWAIIASLIETAKLNGINPHAWLTDTLTKLVNRWPAFRIDQLMPWNYEKAGDHAVNV
jgi:hypothetical protein